MFTFDKTRLDLAREFKASPFGQHSPDLQYMLLLMRGLTTQPFHVLLVDKMGERWTLGLMEPASRTPPRRTNVVFTNLEEAEWHVFKLRWAALAGEDCPVE